MCPCPKRITPRDIHKQDDWKLLEIDNSRQGTTAKSLSCSNNAYLLHYLTGLVAGTAVCLFALIFSRLVVPTAAATAVYQFAGYQYDAATTHFDNTVWTYGSDFVLGVVMVILLLSFPAAETTKPQNQHVIVTITTLKRRSKALLGSYAISVVTGGLGHAFYTTTKARQTWHFRLLWTICVGFVAAAAGIMGAIASEMVVQGNNYDLHRRQQRLQVAAVISKDPKSNKAADHYIPTSCIPASSDWFWAGLGTMTTLATSVGFFSFQRPASDIFVAGTAQSPATFYMIAVLITMSRSHRQLMRRTVCVAGCVGFGLMSLTLPTYPCVVQYSHLSAAAINCGLHACLLVAWTLQGVVLRQVCCALLSTRQQQPSEDCNDSEPADCSSFDTEPFKTNYGTMSMTHSEASFA